MFRDKKFKIVAIAFIVTFTLWFYFSYKLNLWPLIFGQEGIELNNEYLVSMFASFLEDLVFFSFIGFAVYWASNKPSSEEPFKTRVNALANNKESKALDVLTSLEENVARALAFCEYANYEIYLEDYLEDKNLLLISAKIEARIVNMCKDVKYRLKSDYFVEPGEEVDGGYGFVHSMAVYNEKDITKKQGFENESRQILNKEKVVEKINFEIDENGSAITKSSYKIWIKADKDFEDKDNWLYFKFTKFTNALNLTVTNNCSLEIKAALRRYSSDDSKHTELKEVVLNKGITKPPQQFEELKRNYREEDKIELNFYVKE